jgi:UDP-2,4-diacetamido-2,4,6-trideoxy-beta-L-altropyranose hydrolase
MKVAIRADAYAEIGTGHVMRCIALGQGVMERGGEVVFIAHCSSEGLVSRLRSEGFGLHLVSAPGSVTESLGLLEKERPDWVVLDGYHFDAGYQKAMKDAGYKLMVIDDYVCLEHYYADILLNQNYGSERLHYNAVPDAKILLGTKYVMLRKEFLKFRDFERKSPDFAKNMLITMGGADPDNNTLKILKAVNLIESPLNVKVVVGAANPHYEVLGQEVEGSSHSFEILRGVEDMAPLMAWADAAISAGGSTVWELAFMRLPALLCIVADNQVNAVRCLLRDGVFMSFGSLPDLSEMEMAEMVQQLLKDELKRSSMSDKGQEIVDGKGIVRIFDCIDRKPLKILFLGGNHAEELADWLRLKGEKVIYREEKVDADFVQKLNPDMIVSYNYRHILRRDVISIPPRGSVNLHISYLPWNRGADPNVWSLIDNSPKGVTIHYIDEGVDTGDILVQREIFIDETHETLRSSYDILNAAIRELFMENWEAIRGCMVQPQRQPVIGTHHYVKNRHEYEPFLSEKGWDISIQEFKKNVSRTSLFDKHDNRAE